MKTRNCVIGLMLLAMTFCVQAQDKKTQQPTSAKQEVNDNENEAQENTSNANGPARPGTQDTPGASEAAAAANSNEADTTVSNAPAVPQTTSSSSGSPAVLAGEDGAERDGTNSVQRASMNMAGSPVRNLNLSEGQAVDADTELTDRQDRTQEKEQSTQVRNQGSTTPSESDGMNDNTRRENNELSDQNLSSKDKNNQTEQEDDKKSKRKRKKDRG